jgi:hypothetical protein
MPHPVSRGSEPLMLRGSLVVLRRKCGKPSCRCAEGAPHEGAALSYSVGGTTRILSLRPEDVRAVREALSRYRRSLRALDREALAGIATLRRHLDVERAKRRGVQR